MGTGASMVALGVHTGALFSNDDGLRDHIMKASKDSHEAMWPMPINDEHRGKIKSTAADIKNLGGPYGGSCTAAAFLECFVEEGVKWSHFDIAGPALLRGGPRPAG